MTAAAKIPAHVVAQASKSSPNLLREIFYGIGLGIFGGSFWKVHHLNERRKTEEFYARLEAGEISVQAAEELEDFTGISQLIGGDCVFGIVFRSQQ